MKNKPDLNSVFAYGEWLEEFLNNESEYWTLEKLEQDAIRLLCIDRKDIDNSFFWKLYKKIDPTIPDTPIMDEKTFYSDDIPSKLSIDYMAYYVCKLGISNPEWPVPQEIVSKFKNQLYVFPHSSEIERIYLELISAYIAVDIECLKKDVRTILQQIENNNKPWGLTLSEIDQGADAFTALSLERIVSSFSGLAENIVYTKNGLECAMGFTECYAPYVLPWHVIISRIMIKFLFFGGQQYFGFCQHCGKFFVVQRHGRKKFCSDICRAFHHQSQFK